MELLNQFHPFASDAIADRFQPVGIRSNHSTNSISPHVMQVLTQHNQFSSNEAAQAIQSIQTAHIRDESVSAAQSVQIK
jgi:hypothetical protein